jgi:NitT/TauT family transport system substrate-binding protein
MPSDRRSGNRLVIPPAARYIFFALAWLVLISLLQYHFEHLQEKRPVIRMGYMPVITNLAAPLLDEASRKAGDYRFRALKFSSFAGMADALRNGHIEAAFIIAPLAIVLRHDGEDVKVVYIGNRRESTLVTRRDLKIRRFEDLAGHTLAVPMRYSGHYLEARRLADEKGVSPPVKIVEMNPPDMASALASGGLDAYFVGEPFAAQTILAGDSEVLYYVEQLRPHFICNLLLVRKNLIDRDADAVRQLVSAAVRSGFWARAHPEEAARIASRYWNQDLKTILYALTTPPNRIEFDRGIPDPAELQQLADLMVRYRLLDDSNIKGLVDSRFAKEASRKKITDLQSILAR